MRCLHVYGVYEVFILLSVYISLFSPDSEKIVINAC